MARTNASSRFALPPFFLVSNAIIWISAVIVMGILSYFISESNYVGNHVIYEEVIVSPTNLMFLNIAQLTQPFSLSLLLLSS